MEKKINVTIWNEFRHEKTNEKVKQVYPDGLHAAIAKGIQADDLDISLAALDDPERHGLPQDKLEKTDVLIWWGHCAHGAVSDELVNAIQDRVLCGMGLIVLHSGHFSKIFKRMMGTGCSLTWREAGDRERIWNVNPGHPIAEGIGAYFELPQEEMYGEFFDIPQPDELVFTSWFEGGETFRSGCCFKRGYGKIFYFQPGHETYPTYYDKNILTVIGNAVRWAAPRVTIPKSGQAPNQKAIEKISAK